MLTRCRKGLIIVSSKSFLRGGGRQTLLGKLEQEWVTRLGDAAWVDWRLVAERKCRLPHSRDTVARKRTEVYPGTTSIVTPASHCPPLPSVSSPPKLPQRRTLAVLEKPSKQTSTEVVNHGAPPTSPLQPSVSIRPPFKVSGTEERQKFRYKYTTTAETPRLSLALLDQLSKQTSTKVIDHITPPTSPLKASVPIRPPLKDFGIEERQRAPYNYMTTSETPRLSLPVLEQPSKQIPSKVVNHMAPPTSPLQPSVPIQPPLKVSSTEERQRSMYNQTTTSGTPRPMCNHTPVQTPSQTPDDSNEDPSTGGWGNWGWAAIANYMGFKLWRPRQ